MYVRTVLSLNPRSPLVILNYKITLLSLTKRKKLSFKMSYFVNLKLPIDPGSMQTYKNCSAY
uniref:Uncharacterized protein n=2 Tax=Anguilla anguilla TaxID=7936 RepID=A0A0E9RPB0_ANGAN